MFDFHEKRRLRSLFYSKPAIGLLFVLTILLSFSAYNRYEIAVETKEKLEMKQAELRSLQERSDVLKAKVQYLEDERGVEEELRSRFDVAREGEDVIVLVEDQRGSSQIKPLEPAPEEGFSFFEWLKFW